MKELVNVWAMETATGSIVHVKEAKRGDDCGCICLDCGLPLQARKGEERQHHFKHKTGTECNSESILHKVIKETFMRNDRFMLPDGRRYFAYHSCSLEKPVGNLRPDVILHGTEDLHVEVAFTHFINEEKFQKIEFSGHKVVEIDARELAGFESLEALEKMIIHEQFYKNIINWPERGEQAAPRENEIWQYVLGFVLLVSAIILGLAWLTNQQNNRKKSRW